MPYRYDPKLLAKARRNVVLAKQVLKRLRERGIKCALYDMRDVQHGAALHPANLHCGQWMVLVRPMGHVLTDAERAYIQATPGSYLQLGATDVAELIEHINRMTTHW